MKKKSKRKRGDDDSMSSIWDQNNYPSLNNIKKPSIWEKDIFQRHLVMSSTEDLDLTNISHFKLARELKKLGNIEEIKKQNKNIFLTVNNKETSENLMKITRFLNLNSLLYLYNFQNTLQHHFNIISLKWS